MSLIMLLVFVAVSGFVLYVFNILVPLPAPWKNVLNALAGLILFLLIVVWLLNFFGVDTGLPSGAWHSGRRC